MSKNYTGSTDSPEIYRDTAVTNVAVGVSTAMSELTGWTITNPNSSDAYVKMCNIATSGTVVVGTSEVVKTIHAPANSTVFENHKKGVSQKYFSAGISMYAVTGIADNNSTAPTTGLYVEIYYKT